jgi:hypothetical protein
MSDTKIADVYTPNIATDEKLTNAQSSEDGTILNQVDWSPEEEAKAKRKSVTINIRCSGGKGLSIELD